MKTWINRVFLLTICSFALLSCEKDEERVTLRVGTAPVLTASTTSMVLLEEDAANDALTLTWNEADFGFDAAVDYALQIDTAGDNFATAPYTVSMGNELEKSWTVEELNTLLTKLKYTPEEAQDVAIRIRATVSDLVAPVYSNVSTINVTPYSTMVEPGYLYVPGGYQGWSVDTAPALISVEDNGIYTGVISFVGADSKEFKFTPERDWDTDYGQGDTPGSLKVQGGNLTVPNFETYMITANLNNNTWSFAPYSWGLIGSATSTGWDADLDMTYDNVAGVWKITTNLTAGEVKFRLNNDWATNYGKSAAPGTLELNGANIAIAEAGTYQIVLDLITADGVPTYTVTKL